MKTSSLASIVMVLAAASAPAHAQIYKWVDASGKTHYSDTAPAGGKNTATLADRVSVYTPDAPVARAEPVVVASPALSERVDNLERQLQYERLARQQVELAYAPGPQADYGGYAYPVAVPVRRHLRAKPIRPFPGANVVGPGIMPGTFNGPNAVTAGNFTVRTSLAASGSRGGASFAQPR